MLGEALRVRCTEQVASLSVSLMRVNQTARQCGHALLAPSWHIHPDAWATAHLNCTHRAFAPARDPITGIGSVY
jgi:hypothetical protein